MNGKKSKLGLILGISIPAGILFIAAIVVIILLLANKNGENSSEKTSGNETSQNIDFKADNSKLSVAANQLTNEIPTEKARAESMYNQNRSGNLADYYYMMFKAYDCLNNFDVDGKRLVAIVDKKCAEEAGLFDSGVASGIKEYLSDAFIFSAKSNINFDPTIFSNAPDSGITVNFSDEDIYYE